MGMGMGMAKRSLEDIVGSDDRCCCCSCSRLCCGKGNNVPDAPGLALP